MPKRIELAHERITALLDSEMFPVFSQTQLRALLQENRRAFRLPKYMTLEEFISYLEEKSHLTKVQLDGGQYPGFIRYAWRTPTPFQLALSLRGGSYLSHGTAAFIHGLLPAPDPLHVNKEQSAKTTESVVSQTGINRAFVGKPRTSRYLVQTGDIRILLLNGKFTNKLGVVEISDPEGGTLRLTGLERTLIDIAVRPVYAGGATNVLSAYSTAKNRLAPKKMVAILKKLSYAYPYHQAVGFYLSRAGYEAKTLMEFRRLGLEYKFYLDYRMSKPAFDKTWQVYYPSELDHSPLASATYRITSELVNHPKCNKL